MVLPEKWFVGTNTVMKGNNTMNILVVGLGLIGGSLCKAMKKYTYHTVTGLDVNKDIEFAALRDVAADKVFDGDYSQYDLVIIALFPETAEKFFKENAAKFRKGTLITDVCGIKGSFSERMKKIQQATVSADSAEKIVGKITDAIGHRLTT